MFCPEVTNAVPDPLPVDAKGLAAWADALIGHLCGVAPHPVPRHPAVSRALRILEGPSAGTLSLAELAERAGLSSGRLRHLFVSELGLGYRAYVRWRRLLVAATELERGANLAHAAAVAGFADGAHLSRVFRGLFGLPPSAFTSNVTWYRAPRGGGGRAGR